MITFIYYVCVVWLALHFLLFFLVFLSAIIELIADNYQTRMQAHINKRNKMLASFKSIYCFVRDFQLIIKITW